MVKAKAQKKAKVPVKANLEPFKPIPEPKSEVKIEKFSIPVELEAEDRQKIEAIDLKLAILQGDMNQALKIVSNMTEIKPVKIDSGIMEQLKAIDEKLKKLEAIEAHLLDVLLPHRR